MELDYQFITKEIPQKGVAYLLLRHVAPEALTDLLFHALRVATAQGAVRLLASSADSAVLFTEGIYRGLKVDHVHDMDQLERALNGSVAPMEGLKLLPLEIDRAEEWLELYNEGFFYVPNSATYETIDLEAAFAQGKQCGFVLAEGTVAGVYELAPTLPMPEIAGIALLPAFRGRGLGRRLLRAVMAELASQGFQNCHLTVSTANQSAYGLYRSEGFQFTKTRSRWFEVRYTSGNENLTVSNGGASRAAAC